MPESTLSPSQGLWIWIQISSQWESQKIRLAFISFDKFQFWPPCNLRSAVHGTQHRMCSEKQIGRRKDRGPKYFFSVLFSLSPQATSVCVLSVISLLLTNTVSPARACLIIWLERFRGTQKEDDRGPLSIHYSILSGFNNLNFSFQTSVLRHQRFLSYATCDYNMFTRLLFNIINRVYSFSNVMVVGDQRKYLTCLLTLKVGSNIKSFFYFIQI